MEYLRASTDFETFLNRAREIAGLATRPQTYTMVEGVLRAFRRRLSTADAIAFAGALPPILRAIFVADWDIAEPTAPFGDRDAWTADVQKLRRDHNFAPDSAVRDVAIALRSVVDANAFEAALGRLPPAAADFWSDAHV